MSKRPITSYFTAPPTKRPRLSLSNLSPSTHPSYPFPISRLPSSLVLSSRKPLDKDINGEASGGGESRRTNNDAKDANDATDPSDSKDINDKAGINDKADANDAKPENELEVNDTKDTKSSGPTTNSITITDNEVPPTPITRPDLTIHHYNPFLHVALATQLFIFLRASLPFYRVEYSIARAGMPTMVKTPRFTTLFGVDATSTFHLASGELLDSYSRQHCPPDRYRCVPRPVPQCLEVLRQHVSERTNSPYNIVLVNYYADGNDSISYHSDDERFLGENPTIASLSLGARRDFLMKHKTQPHTLTLPLPSGDLLLMQDSTQAKWLHSVPKRSSTTAASGRINITFRNALERNGTENYYRYNVGNGPVYRWDEVGGKMIVRASGMK